MSKDKFRYNAMTRVQGEINDQIVKYNFTDEFHLEHLKYYQEGQFIKAARYLVLENTEQAIKHMNKSRPKHWNSIWWKSLLSKPHKERMAIAASFLIRQIDLMDLLDLKLETQKEVK